MDWGKAFDNIARSGLHSALARLGLGPLYVWMIDTLYANPQFKVRCAGGESEARRASSCIRQGRPLSPYWFLNDFDEQIAE
eukprot:6258933-Lingulodinium_polyedra.AAC.1